MPNSLEQRDLHPGESWPIEIELLKEESGEWVAMNVTDITSGTFTVYHNEEEVESFGYPTAGDGETLAVVGSQDNYLLLPVSHTNTEDLEVGLDITITMSFFIADDNYPSTGRKIKEKLTYGKLMACQ